MSNSDLAFAESVSTTDASLLILIYILILVYCCFGLAVVCDVYFVPALQKLSDTYNLPPDIAGSTLMALGASVPELFASLIGVFITEDDIGTGSIIGSSCFNLIAVPAACAFVAAASFSKELSVSPMPVSRNAAMYAITILVLLLIIKDNKVDMLESVILLLFFVMYMAFMIFSVQTSKQKYTESLQSSMTSSNISADTAIAECPANQLHRSLNIIRNHIKGPQVYGHFYFSTDDKIDASHIKQATTTPTTPVDERTPLVKAGDHVTLYKFPVEHQPQQSPTQLQDQHYQQQQQQQYQANYEQQDRTHLVDSRQLHSQQLENSGSVRIPLGIALKNSTCLARGGTDNCHTFHGDQSRASNGFVGHSDRDHEDSWVSSKWILIPMLPLTLSMKVLTPYKFKTTCWTIWTFLVSITFIGILTYMSVRMVHSFGQTVGIPETISGMTILSWGTGIPELIASIVLIKKTAQTDMAICNTIGSNIIDVSFCLSLPWIVKCLLNKSAGGTPEVLIHSEALPWTSFTLLLSVVLLITILKMHNWMLNFRVGVWLTLVYVTFVAIATYLEYSFSETGLDLLSLF